MVPRSSQKVNAVWDMRWQQPPPSGFARMNKSKRKVRTNSKKIIQRPTPWAYENVSILL